MLIHTLKKALMQVDGVLTGHRMDLISSLVCALIQVRSVNLRKLACSLPGMPNRQSLSPSPAFFQQRGLPVGVYRVDRL